MSCSIFDTVTIEQFKAYFDRDFPFLPLYNELKTYWIGDLVFEDDNFYQSLEDDNEGHPLNNTTYWKKVKGDKYAYITDEDIEKAMTQARPNANEMFGATCNEKLNIYLHLIAFYLVFDMKNAATGINSSYLGTLASKSVGDVSESYNIPQWMLEDPMFSIYSQNGYGLKYLSLIAPYLAITLLFSRGETTLG